VEVKTDVQILQKDMSKNALKNFRTSVQAQYCYLSSPYFLLLQEQALLEHAEAGGVCGV
jgi:hypothetical protein